MQRKAIAKARAKKTAPIARKRKNASDESTLPATVDVTDQHGRTHTLQANSIREAMRMEGDKG